MPLVLENQKVQTICQSLLINFPTSHAKQFVQYGTTKLLHTMLHIVLSHPSRKHGSLGHEAPRTLTWSPPPGARQLTSAWRSPRPSPRLRRRQRHVGVACSRRARLDVGSQRDRKPKAQESEKKTFQRLGLDSRKKEKLKILFFCGLDFNT